MPSQAMPSRGLPSLRKTAVAVGTAALAACALPAAACPLPAPALQKDGVQAAWRVDGPAITAGRHFALVVRVCPADAVLTRVDATMPAHGHGMNYRPSLKPLGPGQWQADGLMFHMPGAWELTLDVQSSGGTVRLRDAIRLP